MNHLFIVNPAAGKGNALKAVPAIKKLFESIDKHCIVEITQKPGHATELVRSYVCKENYRVYSVGGDGTLNEVLNGAVGSKSSLAAIPCGSGNDFIRTILGNSDFENILERTVEGTELPIDIARANGKFFINIASLGFDAEVVYNTIKLKKLPLVTGSMAYILGILVTALRSRSYSLRMEIDSKKSEGLFTLAAIANGRYYGGGMLPAPDAKVNDGFFDLCLVKKISRLKILRLFPLYMKGAHGKLSEVSFIKGRHIHIECSKGVTLNLDGEVERVKQATFEIIPSGIDFVFPKE